MSYDDDIRRRAYLDDVAAAKMSEKTRLVAVVDGSDPNAEPIKLTPRELLEKEVADFVKSGGRIHEIPTPTPVPRPIRRGGIYQYQDTGCEYYNSPFNRKLREWCEVDAKRIDALSALCGRSKEWLSLRCTGRHILRSAGYEILEPYIENIKSQETEQRFKLIISKHLGNLNGQEKAAQGAQT